MIGEWVDCRVKVWVNWILFLITYRLFIRILSCVQRYYWARYVCLSVNVIGDWMYRTYRGLSFHHWSQMLWVNWLTVHLIVMLFARDDRRWGRSFWYLGLSSFWCKRFFVFYCLLTFFLFFDLVLFKLSFERLDRDLWFLHGLHGWWIIFRNSIWNIIF